MRFFSTEGPVRPDDHYAIAPLDRVDVDEFLGLIRAKRYFVLHAPRQTGKTSALIALRDLLNSGKVGNFRCVNVNVEVGQVARDDVARGIRAILSSLATSARLLGDDYPDGIWPDVLAKVGPEDALKELLTRWCVVDPTPLVLLVDEIDSLVGDTLLSVLRQLRAGYEHRPEGFPQSVILCGVRDIRDYRIRSSTGEVIAGGSPFNVAAKSLRMGDFTEAETRALMAQHTEETGQRFTAAAVDAVWTQSCGQPWLVNALCAGACFDNKAGRDRSRAIEVDDVHAAREELILSRRTHLDQLAHKLEEERVRRVVEPMLSGGEARHHARDLEYLRDLGLLAPDSPPRIANPIYREVVPRELGYVLQDSLDIHTRWYVDGDGRLDMTKLLTAFGTFFGEHAEHWLAQLGGVPGGGAAAHLAVVPATGGERRRSHRAGVRVGAWSDGPAGAVAAGGGPAFGPVGAFRGGVQGVAGLGPQEPRMDGGGGGEADVGVHGAVWGGGRASGGDGPAQRGAAARRGAASRRRRGGPPGRRRRGGRRRTPPERARGGGLDAVGLDR